MHVSHHASHRHATHRHAAPLGTPWTRDAWAIVRWPLSARLAVAGLVATGVWVAVLAVIQ